MLLRQGKAFQGSNVHRVLALTRRRDRGQCRTPSVMKVQAKHPLNEQGEV